MKIKATIQLEYSINDSEIARFKERVLECIQEEIDEECQMSLDDISNEIIEEFLNDSVPDIIEDSYKGYGRSGIEFDNYFNTISFDYCSEDISDLVHEIAQQIYDNREENE